MGKKSSDGHDSLPGYEQLTWVDRLRAQAHPEAERVDETGAVNRPKREFLRERIRVRQEEAAAEQKRLADEMKRKRNSEE